MSVSRRALARAKGIQTDTQAREDRRGNGLTPIHVGLTHVVYDELEVAAHLRALGLEWVGDGTIRPIEDEKTAKSAASGGRS